MRVMHLTTHLNVGGISQYIYSLLKEMRQDLDFACVVSSGGIYEERFLACGVLPITLPIRTKSVLNPKVFFAIFPLIKLLKKNKIDIIHAHTRVTQVLSAIVSCITGIPYVTTWHGYYTPRFGRKLFPAYGRRVVAISDPVREDLVTSFGVPAAKISLIYNGIDMDEFEEKGKTADVTQDKKRWGIEGAFPVIGTVARLVADKGHACVIKAFKTFSERYPAAKLLIVGEGKYRSRLDEMVDYYGLRSRVVFVGTVKNVARIIQLMDIFVLVPSLKEGFGLAVIEAMTLRKPVIVSRIGGLTAIVEHDRRGFIIEPEDDGMLVERLAFLAGHPEKRVQFAEAAYRYCRENFTITAMAEKMKTLYDEVLSEV